MLNVTLYTLHDCPFCSQVQERLLSLQQELEFQLETVDLSVRPAEAKKHGVQAVPWIEVGAERLIGPMESDELAKAILRAVESEFASA